MHFPAIVPFLLAMSSTVSALNYRVYSSTNSCSGSSFGCSDNGAVCCGSWPAAYGYSAQFDNLPIGVSSTYRPLLLYRRPMANADTKLAYQSLTT